MESLGSPGQTSTGLWFLKQHSGLAVSVTSVDKRLSGSGKIWVKRLSPCSWWANIWNTREKITTSLLRYENDFRKNGAVQTFPWRAGRELERVLGSDSHRGVLTNDRPVTVVMFRISSPRTFRPDGKKIYSRRRLAHFKHVSLIYRNFYCMLVTN